MKRKIVRPFTYLDINQCPVCKGTLQLVEEETYVGALDSKGLPIGGQSFMDMRLRCTKCHKEYEAEKHGICYTIKHTLPPIVPIMEDFNPFYQ